MLSVVGIIMISRLRIIFVKDRFPTMNPICLVPSKLPPTPPMEEETPAPETRMTKLGASKRKRTSSGDGEHGKLVLEVVGPAVDEPEEKANKIDVIS